MSARTVSILGATGSIGCNTVDLLARNPDAYRCLALVARNNVRTLAEQARVLRPELAVIADEAYYPALKKELAGTGISVAAGDQGVEEAADQPADWVMAAIVGAAGLRPTLRAVRRGATIALANKECLVCAGDLLLREVKAAGATLLPVDSEHNAIFQVFDFDRPDRVARVILTASGGPFREFRLSEMAQVTPEQAVAHPNWSMGAKISVDSATLMNKGLELIEAKYLFPISVDQLDVVVHPQSVIHSMVEYVDGSVLAQMGTPDMRTPISYALAYPGRLATPAARLDLCAVAQLTFEAPDAARFPALNLAWSALRSGGAAPAILNAANEVAVHAFLSRRIGFLDIAAIVADVLDVLPATAPSSLDAVLALDAQARDLAAVAVERKMKNR
jgi:1-deoxy-D-xylulose-5-phosphate reductoisomerase